MPIECTGFRKFERGTLLGFADYLLSSAGIEIKECSVHEKNGHRWVNPPSKQYEKPDGTKGYSPLIRFSDDKRYQAFQKEALLAVEKHLQGQSPPENDEDIDF